MSSYFTNISHSHTFRFEVLSTQASVRKRTCVAAYIYLEEKETHTYLGEVLASGVGNLKIKESGTLGAQMQKCNIQRFNSQAVFIRA